MRRVALGAVLVSSASLLEATPEPAFRLGFTAEYCSGCHSGDKPEGDFHTGEADLASSSPEIRERWLRASEYVVKGIMPPFGARKPSEDERERFFGTVQAELGHPGTDVVGSGSPVRRLNRIEYLNTLRDLFQIREIRLPVTFPDDNPDLRFDTMAEGTRLSPGHLDAFHDVATDLADRMVPLPTAQERVSVSARGSVGQDPSRTKFWTRDGDDNGLYFTGINIAGWSGALWDKAFIAHASGIYRVRLTVSTEAPEGADGKPLRVSFYAFNPADYDLPKRALRIDLPRVGGVEVTNSEPATVDVEVRLEKGETFHLYCENRLAKQYPPALIRNPGNTQDLRRLLAAYLTEAQESPEPTIRFERMEIRGPLRPLPRQEAFLGGQTPTLDRAYLGSVLLPLAERAFRRPLTEEEREELIEDVAAHGKSAPAAEYAVHYGIRRILLSPQFLFREFGDGRLDDYGLASRLSYFLWSTMPDSQLLQLARERRLSETLTLRREVARMVRDPKAQQFVKHFSGQWLGGRSASSVMVCDVRHVWSELIRFGIVRSTEMFFDEILQENRSIRAFIDSDFTYANEPMRIAWGIPGNEVDLSRLEADQRQSLLWPEPERLDLSALAPEVPRHVTGRGGVLGLSTVLAATGDGVESSPILRGVWVLENLFGTPPPPPPADVPALVADISQARTVREVLSAHQNVSACSVCHVKIDPIGLALENYDAVGGWRTSYYKDEQSGTLERPVEANSRMEDGTKLQGAQDIKDYLLDNPGRFTKALAGLLLEYGTGRDPTRADRLALDVIAAAEPEGGYGFRDLIASLVASKAFRTK